MDTSNEIHKLNIISILQFSSVQEPKKFWTLATKLDTMDTKKRVVEVDSDGGQGVRERLYVQLVAKDNWEVVDEIDFFGYIYDSMPPKMKMVVDMRSSGMTIKDISSITHISIYSIYNHLRSAKKRILRSGGIL